MIDHRMFVTGATPDAWGGDRDGRDVVELLKRHGLKPSHRLLDFGCGPLRVGRWLIEYLNPNRYFGIDPEVWLIEMARLEEVPAKAWRAKRPRFDANGEFKLNVFGVKFDYVIISDVFVHAADRQIAKTIRGLAAVLAPGGTALGNIIYNRQHLPEGDKWEYPRIAMHELECLTEPAAKYGLKCEVVSEFERSGLLLYWFKFTRQEAA